MSQQRTFPYVPKSGAVAGQTFTSDRRYRNALARLQGHASSEAQRRSGRAVTHLRQLFGLHPAEQRARRSALDALADMRGDPSLSLEEVARRHGTTPGALIRHAGKALTRDGSGHYRAKAADRLYRPLRALTTEGEIDIDVRSSRVASLIARHWSAVRYFLDTGNATVLAPFVGKRVLGHELETRPEVIEERGHRGELSFEDLYRG